MLYHKSHKIQVYNNFIEMEEQLLIYLMSKDVIKVKN